MPIPAGSPAAPRLFPSDGARYAIRANGDRAKSATAEYFMEGPSGQWLPLEMYAYDGTDTPGALISPSVLLLDSYGGQVDFWGPADGRTRVWMSIDGGPLVPVEANHRHRLDDAELAAAALAAEVADLQPGGDGDAALVHRTGNEPVAGVKTFADSPIVPTPTTDGQAAPKSYIDTADSATRKATIARRLHTALDRTRGLLPAVHASPPTITYGTSRTLSARQHQPIYPTVRNLGGGATYDGSVAKVVPTLGAGAATVGLDFWLDGDQVEFSWFCAQNNKESIWVWVDGQPCTAAPSPANGGTVPATTAGVQYYGKLTFGSVARRRITVYAGLINAWSAMGTLVTGAVSPAQRRPRIAVVGDSYCEMNLGGVNPIGAFSMVAGFALGAEVLQRGIGGTGYTTAQPFGSATRVANVAAGSPDAIVIVGSVNDGATGLQDAATAAFDAYAAACPRVPIFVYGPQASSATGTISAGRQAAIAAVQAAANAHSAVWGFADLVGTAAALPAAYSAGTTYNTGDKVTYLGSVWQLNNGASTLTGVAPSGSGRWQLVTWGLTGTGNSGATASDGSRDLLLYSDNVHPTAAGSEYLGLAIASDLMQQLAALAAA